MFSLSNNHTYDKGAKGIAATLRFWDEMPEDVVTTGLWYGESDYGTIPLQTVNGVTIAYLSYTDHTNGIPQSSAMTANVIYTSQRDVMEQQVRRARELADFVVVGVHWGVEDSHKITQTQRDLAQQLSDWGADVIWARTLMWCRMPSGKPLWMAVRPLWPIPWEISSAPKANRISSSVPS